MSVPAKRAAVYKDLFSLPDHVVGEIVAGEMVVSPRPALEHSQVASILGMDLGAPFQRGRGGPGGWWILDEPELHWGNDVLVPDLAGWRTSRMPQSPTGAYATIAPDWVCEVLSPSTAGTDRVRKLPIYLREGVQWVWFVDPIGRTLEVLKHDATRWVMQAAYSDADKARAEPFDAIELDLGSMWPAREVVPEPIK